MIYLQSRVIAHGSLAHNSLLLACSGDKFPVVSTSFVPRIPPITLFPTHTSSLHFSSSAVSCAPFSERSEDQQLNSCQTTTASQAQTNDDDVGKTYVTAHTAQTASLILIHVVIVFAWRYTIPTKTTTTTVTTKRACEHKCILCETLPLSESIQPKNQAAGYQIELN